ncbi:MAG: S8 family serine peptidase [Thiolinea sp.]
MAQQAVSPAIHPSCQASSLWCVPAVNRPPRTDYADNELLLLYDARKPENFSEAVMRQFGLQEKSNHKLKSIRQTMITASTNGQSPPDLVQKINQQQKEIEASTNNLFFTAAVEPGRQRKNYPMALTGIETAHKYTKGRGTKVCLIDTAIDASHSSLDNARVQSYQLINGSAGGLRHGTEVAGVIISKNPRIGVAPEASLISMSAFSVDAKSGEYTSNAGLVARAMDFCIGQRVDIMNLSFAGGRDDLVGKMVRKAIDSGIVVVASAGNNGPGAEPAYPAAIPDVIAVTAVDQAENIFGLANRGSYIDLAAPGVDILTTAPRGSFNRASGTSLATAHVTGVIALLMSINRQSFRPVMLEKTAIDLGSSGRDNDFGYGLVNIERALQMNKLR